ncbi:MAG: thioesterase family protein [Caldilineaceae bacterium]|nr:thioesterase family protein [Caldilineaceae bacterium]
MALAPGLTGEASATVDNTNTAASLGSGLVPVFGTPALIALLELAAVHAVMAHLPPGSTSVGTHVDVRHLAATPTGMGVRANATLTAVDGRQLHFVVEAFDEVEKVGEGTHIRMIVERERFVQKAVEKANRAT